MFWIHFYIENQTDFNQSIKAPEETLDVIKPNFEHEPSASPSSHVQQNKQSHSLPNNEESQVERRKNSKIKKSAEKDDFSRQKDQDNIDEEVSSNDSYLDWFIEDAVLIEANIFKDTPLHEQTITYARRNELNSKQLFDDSDLDDDRCSYSVAAIATITENAPVLLKPIVEFLIKQIDKSNC